MSTDSLLFSCDKHQLYARQFESGARLAAESKGMTIVIDVFRASNTMLELMEAGAKVKPVVTVEEAMKDQYNSFIRVGEDEGEVIGSFDFDNSPVTINQQADKFKGRNAVIRTTNGTRGILSALGSDTILVGTFRNFDAVKEIALKALKQGTPVSFVGMGTLENYRIEDAYCAKMFFIKILEELGETELVDKLTEEGNNPWSRDWRQEIMDIRGDTPHKLEDYKFSLNLNTTNIVPTFDPTSGYLVKYNGKL